MPVADEEDEEDFDRPDHTKIFPQIQPDEWAQAVLTAPEDEVTGGQVELAELIRSKLGRSSIVFTVVAIA